MRLYTTFPPADILGADVYPEHTRGIGNQRIHAILKRDGLQNGETAAKNNSHLHRRQAMPCSQNEAIDRLRHLVRKDFHSSRRCNTTSISLSQAMSYPSCDKQVKNSDRQKYARN